MAFLNSKAAVLIATVGAEGVVDTGASRTVVGSERVKGIWASVSTECRENIIGGSIRR